MKYDKFYLRNKFLKQRKKRYLTAKKFNFNKIFGLIKKHFYKWKIIIAGYYPSIYEVNVLQFLEKSSHLIFTYEFDISYNNLANENIKLMTLSNYSTLLKIAKKTEYISESEFKTLNKWNTNPSSWQ